MGHAGYSTTEPPPPVADDEAIAFYVAGASKQLDRAKTAMASLVAAGYRNTRDWTPFIEAAIKSGIPEDKLPAERRNELADGDLEGVLNSDVVWFLVPDKDVQTKGAWVEFGFALALAMCMENGALIVCSGPNVRSSIFTELADGCFDTDEEALAYIQQQIEEDEDDDA